MTRILLLLLALCASCATAPSPDAAQKPKIAPSAENIPSTTDPVSYYKGTMTATSADGLTPMGPPAEALVKRELFPDDGRIVETTLDEGALRVTTLTQTEGNTFAATDADGTFAGTVIFSPDPWSPISWTYDLTMADGSGKVIGGATVTKTSIKTSKYFVTPDGLQKMRIIDDLKTVSAKEYEAALP